MFFVFSNFSSRYSNLSWYRRTFLTLHLMRLIGIKKYLAKIANYLADRTIFSKSANANQNIMLKGKGRFPKNESL